jgi:tetratricopeptide (TPR) repeat protein
VTVQLIDGTTGTHIWSKSYDDRFGEILQLERRIAEDVARRLDATIVLGLRQDTKSSRAHEFYLQGQFFYRRRAGEDLRKAQEFFTQALDIDPEFAGAWVGIAAIANVRLHDRNDREMDPQRRAEIEEAQEHAIGQALKFGPMLPEAHIRAAVFYHQRGEPGLARQHFETARRLEPDHWLVRGLQVQQSIDKGRIADAVKLQQGLVRQDPLNGVSQLNLGELLMMAGRFEDALAQYARAFELYPSLATSDLSWLRLPRALILLQESNQALEVIMSAPAGNRRLQGLALAYHALGRDGDSDLALNQLESRASGPEDQLAVAEVYAYRREVEQALAWLAKLMPNVQCRSAPSMQDVFYSPFLAFLGEETRWQAWRLTARQEMAHCSF